MSLAVERRLRLGRIAETLPERLVLADKQELALDELLLLVLTDEISRRENTAATNRATEARLGPNMRLELWDKTSKVCFDKRLLAELVSLRFIEAHRHVVVLGPVGVGKTFMGQALGHIACRRGYHVRFTRADEMLRRLRQSRFDNSRDAEMTLLTSVDLLRTVRNTSPLYRAGRAIVDVEEERSAGRSSRDWLTTTALTRRRPDLVPGPPSRSDRRRRGAAPLPPPSRRARRW